MCKRALRVTDTWENHKTQAKPRDLRIHLTQLTIDKRFVTKLQSNYFCHRKTIKVNH